MYCKMYRPLNIRVLHNYEQLVETGTTDPIVWSIAVITAWLLEHVTRKQESVRVVVKLDGRNLRVTQVRMLWQSTGHC